MLQVTFDGSSFNLSKFLISVYAIHCKFWKFTSNKLQVLLTCKIVKFNWNKQSKCFPRIPSILKKSSILVVYIFAYVQILSTFIKHILLKNITGSRGTGFSAQRCQNDAQ